MRQIADGVNLGSDRIVAEAIALFVAAGRGSYRSLPGGPTHERPGQTLAARPGLRKKPKGNTASAFLGLLLLPVQQVALSG